MSVFPGSPYVIRSGIVLIDPVNPTPRIIRFQYNPDTLTRTLQVKGIGGEGSNRSEALRLTGPPVETIKLDAEFDSTDQFELTNPVSVEVGIQAQLAALEMIIYPSSRQLITNNLVAQTGTLEIIPMETALTLFIWNKNRILPVRLTDFSIVEEAFDTHLNPIRAKVSIGMRVLNIDDLGYDHKGSGIYMSYQQNKERLAARLNNGTLNDFGIKSLP